MRITTGAYKGRVLKTVNDLSVRPATDRVRQTIYNMLANRLEIEGAAVLDLFAGSGSLGFEALSRGAAGVLFVESDRRAAEYLEENIRMLGCGERATILDMDAMEFLSRPGSANDLVFADPPYAFGQTAAIPGLVIRQGLLRRHGYLIVEHARDLHFDSTPLYRAGPEKRFGRTIVTFFQHSDAA